MMQPAAPTLLESCKAEVPEQEKTLKAAQTTAVIKVQCKDEVLRFRVAFPLDLEEVRSNIFSTVRRERAANTDAQVEYSKAVPMLLYHGADGKLLELCDTTANDFIERYSDPKQPIRLQVVARRQLSEDKSSPHAAGGYDHEDPPADESEDPSNAQPLEQSTSTAHEEAPGQSSSDNSSEQSIAAKVPEDEVSTTCGNDAPETQQIGRSDADSDAVDAAMYPPQKEHDTDAEGYELCDATDIPTASDEQGHASSSDCTGGSDFIGTVPSQPTSTESKAAGQKKHKHPTRISLPIAARTAAYALSDMFESARDKLNDALSVQDSVLSPGTSELQRALRESEELQKAIQKSAGESRARLAKVLDLYELKLRPVQADGNCQFRALAAQLYDDESQHLAVRIRVVEELKERREKYSGHVLGTFDEYLERMARDGEWGDNVTLQAASDAFNRGIHVLTDQPGSALLEIHPEARPASNDEAAQESALCLAFLTEVHYDAVVIRKA